MLNRFLNHIHSRPELLILVLVTTIIKIVVKLTTYLVDFLIDLNIITAVLALSIGMLPGFPLPVFVMLAMTLGTLLLMRQRQIRTVPLPAPVDYADGMTLLAGRGDGQPAGDYPDRMMPEALAVILQVSCANYARLEKKQLCERLRGQFLIDFGVTLPPLMLRPCEHRDDRTVGVLLNEIRADTFTIHFDMLRRSIPGNPPVHPT